MKSLNSLVGQNRSIGFFFLLLMSFLLLMGCTEKKEPQETSSKTTETTEQSATPSKVSVAITKIDDAAPQSGQIPQVGRQVIVEGTISDPQITVCVLVHPMASDTWWVQNLPSPPGKVDDKTWRWRTMALCGTGPEEGNLGLNEEFEIVAFAESQRAICQLGKTIKTQDFPNDLPRSEIVTVKRVKN